MLKKISFGLVAFGFATQVVAAPLTMGQIYNYARKGDMQSLRKVAKRIDSVGKDGNTNLCRAVYNNDYKAFNALKTAGASVQHACVKKIPAEKIKAFNEGYANWAKGMNASAKVATGTTTAGTVATTTGLSTGATVGIGVGAVALIGGGIALAAGGGGGGGSSAPVCSGHGTKDTEGLCVCDTGYAGDNCETCAGGFINQGGVCYAELGCVNGTQNKDKCDCRNGWNGTLCETANACEGYETSCPVGYAQSATCQRGDTPVYQCNNCASGYIKLNGVCVEEMDCNHGTQSGDRTCDCNQGWGGDVCDTCDTAGGYISLDGGCYLDQHCDTSKHLHQEANRCVCDAGYSVEYQGECYALIVGGCGTNEMQQGNECVCKSGYDKIDGVCTLTACPAGTYLSGSNCVSCPANSTSPSGSTSADQCTCISGYKKAGYFCVPNTQSGKIYKMGHDTGSNIHTIDKTEHIEISSPNLLTDGKDIENDAAIEILNGATLINNGTITASSSPDIPYDVGGFTYYEKPFGYTAIESDVFLLLYPNTFNYITNNGTINGRSSLSNTHFVNNGTVNLDDASNIMDGVGEHAAINLYSNNETESTLLNYGTISAVNAAAVDISGILKNYGTISSSESSGGTIYGSSGTIENYGTIVATGSVSSAIFVEAGDNLTVNIINNGLISQQGTTGLECGIAVNGIGNNTTITNNGDIAVNSGVGIDMQNGGTIINNGTITLGSGIGIWGSRGAIIENYGDVVIENDGGIGILGTDGSTVYNAGTITIANESKTGNEVYPLIIAGDLENDQFLYGGKIGSINSATGLFSVGNDYYVLPDESRAVESEVGDIEIAYYKNCTGTGTREDPYVLSDYYAWNSGYISLSGGATLTTSGTLNTGLNALDFSSFSTDGTGKVVALPNAQFKSETAIKDDLYLSNDFVTNNFDTTVVAKDMIQTPDTTGLNLISQSALFNASLAENGKDVIMTMKGFDTATDNESLSDFLTHNYAMGNNEGFFNKLKGFGDVGSLTAGLNSLTGQDMLSRFNFEDMTMMRELNFDMNDKLFHNKKQSFSLAGSVSPMAFKGDTGSNARYSLFNKRQGKFSLGLGVAFTDVRSDDDHNDNARSETMYQLVVPMGYKTHGFNLVTSPRLGYARGSYDRTGFEGKNYDGTIEKRVFGLMNEARYPMMYGDWSVEPSAEFNVIGYQQKGSEDAKEYSLNIKSQNTYSVEGGFGLYLNKVKELAKDKTLKLNLGASVYHEFADPYQLEVGLTGMDGSFMLRDEERSDNRAVVRAGFDYAEEDYSIYGSFISYIDREVRTALKSGFKWKF